MRPLRIDRCKYSTKRPFTIDRYKYSTMKPFTKIDVNTVQRDHIQR